MRSIEQERSPWRVVRFGLASADRSPRRLRLPALRGRRLPYEIRSISTHFSAADPSYKALLEGGEIDALYLGVRTSGIAWLDASLRAGLPVVSSVAPSLPRDGWRRIDALGRRTGASLMVASPVSCAPLHREAANLVHARSIGAPLSLAVRVSAARPVGSLLRVAFELSRRIFGCEPGEVIAVSAHERPRVLNVALRVPGDRILTAVCGDGGPPGLLYEVEGTRGSLRVSAPAADPMGTLTLGASAAVLPAGPCLEAALERSSAFLVTGRDLSAAREAIGDADLLEEIAGALRSADSRSLPPRRIARGFVGEASGSGAAPSSSPT
jgi:predicted dehydrogenase